MRIAREIGKFLEIPMARIKILLCILVAIFLISCTVKELRVKEYRVSPNTPDPTQPPDEFYVIGAGDTLNVQLWKEPTLSGLVRVRPDGFITLPLVNEVQTSGLTTEELRKLLKREFLIII